jgi:hypothetical protein
MGEVKKSQGVLRYAGMATEWMLVLLLAVWAGHKADGMLNWKVPVFVILLPVAALIFLLWKLVKDVSKQK